MRHRPSVVNMACTYSLPFMKHTYSDHISFGEIKTLSNKLLPDFSQCICLLEMSTFEVSYWFETNPYKLKDNLAKPSQQDQLSTGTVVK